MKMISAIQTVVGALAALYFARSDEGKQAVMEGLISAHELHAETQKVDLTKQSMSNLTDDLDYYRNAHDKIDQSMDRAEAADGHFDTSSKFERSLAWGALGTYKVLIGARIGEICDEIKSRY